MTHYKNKITGIKKKNDGKADPGNFSGDSCGFFKNASRDGFFIADRNGKLIDVNQSGCKILEYTANEIIGKNISDFFHPGEIPDIFQRPRIPQTHTETLNLKTRKGEFIEVRTISKYLPDGTWNLLVMSSAPEQTQSGRQLQKERLWENMFEKLVQPVILLDSGGRIKHLNQKALSIFGYLPGDLEGRTLEKIISSGTNFLHEKKDISTHQTEQRGLELSGSGLRKNRTKFPVVYTISDFFIEKDRFIVLILKELRNKLFLVSRQKFLSETLSILLASLDLEKKLKKVTNHIIPFLSDFSAVILFGKNDKKFVKAAHNNKVKEQLLSEISEELFRDYDDLVKFSLPSSEENLLFIKKVTGDFLKNISRNRNHFRKLKELQPKTLILKLLIVRKKPVGIMIFGISESSKRFSEEDLSLVKTLSSHTEIAINNAFLFADSQDAIKEQEEILAIVSHDLRNSIGVVKIGCSILPELIKKPERQKETEKILLTALKSTDYMERLVADLLDSTKIREGTLSLSFKSVNLAELGEQITTLYEARAKEKSITVLLRLPENPVSLECDHTRIIQVLSNLISNALKFTPQNGLIEIIVSEMFETIQFSVKDSGIGIPQDKLEKVFERYWQAKKTAHQGTGLGLYISKGIVEAHHGNIWAESAEGSGSTFRFCIPVKNNGD